MLKKVKMRLYILGLFRFVIVSVCLSYKASSAGQNEVGYDDAILSASNHTRTIQEGELPICVTGSTSFTLIYFDFSDTSCNRNLMLLDPVPELTLRLGDSTNVGTEYSN